MLTESDPQRAIQQAVALHQQGRLSEAEPLYRKLLTAHPDHFNALHFLGILKLQQGDAKEAHALITSALRVNPASAEALSNRATASQALQRHEEAVADYDKAIALKPDYVDALFNRGNALQALGRHDEALASYDRALGLRSAFPAAWCNRGNTLQALHRYADAISAYDQAVALRQVYPEALHNRGGALAALGRHDEAIASYDRALAVDANRVDALYGRGFSLEALDRTDDALADFERALALAPGRADILCSRAAALVRRKRFDEALASYNRVLALDPDIDYALGDAAYLKARLCDWRDHDDLMQRIADGVRSGKRVAAPFIFLTQCDDPAAQYACALSSVSSKYPAAPAPLWNGARYNHNRIRIAYVSADWHEHAMAYLTAGLFERHDRSRFEVCGFSLGVDDGGEMRSRISAAFDRFVDVRGRSDTDVARMLRDAEVDIAIDLNGLTEGARPGIFALRAAPIQVTYLGYPGTTGAPYFDYLLADQFVIPLTDKQHYAEQVVYLPGCYQVNDDKRRIAERTPSRTELGLPEDAFVFCCFNNHHKITPQQFDIWMRLLQRVNESVLWLLAGPSTTEQNLRREAQARGSDPARLVFAPRMRLDEHLARHRAADLFLDTLPYNAHTTASDALWAGLPVLTCVGKSFPARVAGSLLHAIGLPELVTTSLREYEALALALANDPARLREIKERLARNRLTQPLFDTDRFRQNIEDAYETMWSVYQETR